MTTARSIRFLATLLCAVSGVASAGPFTNIRIGDADGFGFARTAGLVRATVSPHTTAADTNGNGVLQQTEYLPDLNKDGAVAWNSGDNFDNRSAAERADTGLLGGSGFVDAGTSGFNWTDVSLSTSFTGSDFPDPGGPAAPNEPTFVFDFAVAAGDLVPGSTLFFNLIFGDYDVVPASIRLTFASGSRTVALTTQGGGDDGLIQAATASLSFSEVFTANGSGGWDGFLTVSFIAPNEPYTAFDFVELSLDRIPFDPLPAPATLALVPLALWAAARTARRSRSRALAG